MRGWGWSWHVGLGLLLIGCPGEVTPGGSAGDGSSTGDQPGITTFNSTVDPTVPGEGEAESMEGEGSAEGTTMGPLDGTTTDGGMTSEPGTSSTTDPGTASGSTTDSGTTSGSTTDPGTTSGSTTDPGTTSGSTTDPGTTSGSTTDPGTTSGTTGGGCHSVAGNYENCLNMDGTTNTAPCMAPGDSTCLIAGGMPPTAGICSVTDCADACDCPPAPATGDAVVSCDDVTGDPAELFCYLDCSSGETCPVGTTCFGGFLCIWPGAGAAGEPYGDCFNNDASICGLDGVCLSDDAMMPTSSVCTTECAVVGDCPAAPPGGTSPVVCQDVTTDGANECLLDCAGGTACPPGMTCFSGFICMWN